MDKEPHRTLQAAHALVAFTTAAIEVARERRRELEEELESAAGPHREVVKRWLIEVEQWLGKANSLMSTALNHAREVSRVVARVERGLVDSSEEIISHGQKLEKLRLQVIDDFLSHTSREQLKRAEDRQDQLLSEDSSTEDPVEEFEEQMSEFESILEAGQEHDRTDEASTHQYTE